MINDKIEAVFICTPNYLNKPLTKLALNKGKHVVKTPFIHSCRSRGYSKGRTRQWSEQMYGPNHRHHESIKKIKTLVYGKEMGKIYGWEGATEKVNEDFFQGWRAKREFAGGYYARSRHPYPGLNDLLERGLWQCNQWSRTFIESWWNWGQCFRQPTKQKNRHLCINTFYDDAMEVHFSLEIFWREVLILNGLKTSSGAVEGTINLSKRNNSYSASAIYESEVQETWSRHHGLRYYAASVEKGKPIELGNSNDALQVMRIIDKIYSKITYMEKGTFISNYFEHFRKLPLTIR